MICRLCLKNVECIIDIFNELGKELSAAEIVAKHFWFEPRPDDPISTAICEACWSHVTEFHEFYRAVEEAHRLLTERFSLRFDSSKEKKTQAPGNENDVTTTTAKSIELEKSPKQKDGVSEPTNLNEIQIDANEENFDNVVDDLLEAYNDILSASETNEVEAELPRATRASHRRNRTACATSKEKTIFSLTTSLNKSKQSIDSDEKNDTPKRPRGRPRKSSIISKSPLSSEPQIAAENESIDQTKKNYKARISDADGRISEFLKLSCDVCGLKEPTFLELCQHMMNTHKKPRGYAICCLKKFYKRVALLDHVEKHLNPETFSCKECDKTFADKQCLKNHITIKHLPEESKNFACDVCDKKFAKPYLLQQHQRQHKERNHICEFCQKGFPSQNQLKAHIKVIHNNYGTMCDICAKVIRGHAAFKRHLLQHEGVEMPKVQCTKCGSWHKDKYSLQKHIKRHNIEGTKHICNECGKIAPNRSALLAHMRYVHKAQRSYGCGLCKKSFKKQINLKEHMAMHTGEALYNCPHCARTFNSNANMHSHRKKMHPKEFAAARTQRQTTTPTDGMAPKPTESEHAVQSTGDNNHILTIDDEIEETRILMTTDKFGELVFKLEGHEDSSTI